MKKLVLFILACVLLLGYPVLAAGEYPTELTEGDVLSFSNAVVEHPFMLLVEEAVEVTLTNGLLEVWRFLWVLPEGIVEEISTSEMSNTYKLSPGRYVLQALGEGHLKVNKGSISFIRKGDYSEFTAAGRLQKLQVCNTYTDGAEISFVFHFENTSWANYNHLAFLKYPAGMPPGVIAVEIISSNTGGHTEFSDGWGTANLATLSEIHPLQGYALSQVFTSVVEIATFDVFSIGLSFELKDGETVFCPYPETFVSPPEREARNPWPAVFLPKKTSEEYYDASKSFCSSVDGIVDVTLLKEADGSYSVSVHNPLANQGLEIEAIGDMQPIHVEEQEWNNLQVEDTLWGVISADLNTPSIWIKLVETYASQKGLYAPAEGCEVAFDLMKP